VTIFSTYVRQGIRVLVRKPAISIIVVVTLGLGIGANTAIFTFVNAILLKPLLFPNADRLAIAWTKRTDNDQRFRVAPADYLDWKNENRSFDSLEAYQPWIVNRLGAGESNRLLGYRASVGLFQMLGAKFLLGRGFAPQDGISGQDREVVLSYNMWKRDLGGRNDVLGSSIDLEGAEYRIIGVVDANYDWPILADLWVPLVMSDAEKQERKIRSLVVVGRVRADRSLAQAQSDMDIVAAEVARRYPEADTGMGISLIRLPGQFGEAITRMFVLLLMGAFMFVLLLVCTNVTNLLLADAMGRQREIAVRAFLGARRWQIVLQSLTESTLLAAAGGVLGFGIAFWGVPVLRATIPQDQLRFIPGAGNMVLGERGVLFAIVCTLGAGITSGFGPALLSARCNMSEALRSGGRGSTRDTRSKLSQGLLIATEFALALVLLVSTGLMVKGFEHLGAVQNLGFETDSVLTMNIRVPTIRTAQQTASFYKETLSRVGALPGVQDAAVVGVLPFSGDTGALPFVIEGQPTAKTVELQRAAVEATSENYFQLMHIPVVTGRAFSEHDDQGSEPVAIVSSRAAHEYWHSQNPIGSRIRIGAGAKDGWLRIIGVVGDVKQSWLDTTPPPMIYVNYLQSPAATTAFVVRAADSASLVPAIRKVISQQDERVAIYSITSMNQFVQDMIAGIRVAAGLMAMFGAIAMILAAAGVYSMIANEVSVRKREIGIRIAMGATPSDVVRLFVMRALKLGAIGLAIGLLMAFVITRLMSNSLFGIVTLDPFTFLAFVIILAAIAVLGAYIPARRAARVDPIIVLRYE